MLVMSITSGQNTAKADWNAAAMQWAERFSSQPVKFSNGGLISIWANAQVKRYAISPPEYSRLFITYPKFKNGGGVNTVLRNLGKTAPLVVYLSGVFGNAEDDFGFRAVEWFASRGYHVLVLPNAWGRSYLEREPSYDPGDVENEAKFVLAAIRQGIQAIGESQVSRVELVGESYGGFLASAVAVLDANSRKPLIQGSYTLISPPFNVLKAIANIDQIMNETDGGFRQRCVGDGYRIYRYFAEMLLASREAWISSELESCGSALLVHWMQDLMVDAARRLDRMRGLGKAPDAQRNLTAFEDWKSKLRFETVVREYTPTVYLKAMRNRRSQTLTGILVNLPREAQSRVRIITAQDDMLNLGAISCNANEFGLTSSNLIMLPWGGHIGFTELPEFQNFIDVIFTQQ